MNTFYIGLGSNIGNRHYNLQLAIKRLEEHFSIIACSSVYETKALLFKEQDDFLNKVLKAKTNLSIERVFKIIKDIEVIMGRENTFRYGPRLIDIDLLLYANCVISIKGLTVPHPSMLKRRFVLEPLFEIDKNLTIPPHNKSIDYYLKQIENQYVLKLK